MTTAGFDLPHSPLEIIEVRRLTQVRLALLALPSFAAALEIVKKP